MAFPRSLSVDPGFFAEVFKRPSPPEDRLIPDSVENGGIGHRAREARQKRWPESEWQRSNRRVVDPALDGPREVVEFGKEGAERPAHGRVAAVRAAGPPCLH